MAKKVLVVDDVPSVTALVCKLADGLGFEARAVNQSKLAIDAFLDFKPDVVVLDMLMPEKDGIDLLHEILAVDPSVRLILISGFGADYLRLAADVARYHGATQVSVLAKPLRAPRLAELLGAP